MSLRPKCLQNENNYEIVGLIQLRTDREKGKASDVDEGDGTAEDEQQPPDLRAHVDALAAVQRTWQDGTSKK